MESDQNPMKDPVIRDRIFRKILTRQTSAFELRFHVWALNMGIGLIHTGQGLIWISRRNPDFRVSEQKKAVELTQKGCFIGKRIPRNPENYGRPTISHYKKHGWNCLVVFLRHMQTPPDGLKNALINYSLPESNWSGIWFYDKLIISGKLIHV